MHRASLRLARRLERIRRAGGDFRGEHRFRTRAIEKFIAKYDLPFPLLSDPEKKIVNAYGVWVEKSMYGRKYMGAERTTFIIDPRGRIATILRKVKPAEHVDCEGVTPRR